MNRDKILEKIDSLKDELDTLIKDSERQVEEFIKSTNLQAASIQGKIQAYQELIDEEDEAEKE